MWWKILAASSLLVLVVSCSSDDSSPASGEGATTAEVAATATKIPAVVTGLESRDLTAEQESSAIAAMSEFPEVVDGQISKRSITDTRIRAGTTLKLTLVLTVNADTTVDRAKELGEEFVRAVMRAGPEPAPLVDSLGEGFFEYVIDVITPDNSRLARGTKSNIAVQIFWS